MAYPILAPAGTWYDQGGLTILRGVFKVINIVDSYTPTGNEDDSWDGSAALDGSIMVYASGTTLTIAGNGSGGISLSPNAQNAFSYGKDNNTGSNYMDYRFGNITQINGLDLLDTSNVTNMSSMFFTCQNLTFLDIGGWDVSNVTNMKSMFSHCKKITSFNHLNSWDVSNVTNMNSMFGSCDSITTIDLSGWDTSNVTNMNSIFFYDRYLTSINISGWDTSKVTDMSSMFYACYALNSITIGDGWDTSKATTMSNLFNSCYVLPPGSFDFNRLNISNVTEMNNMFAKCYLMTTEDFGFLVNWDTSKVTNMAGMFSHCTALTALDLSHWNTSNVKNISDMFAGCTALTTLNLTGWNMSKVTSLYQTFGDCKALTALDVSNWDTSNVKTMYRTFLNCSSLTTLDVSNWDTSKVTDMGAMFCGCTNLTTLDVSNWDVSKVTKMPNMFASNASYSNTMKVRLDTYKWDTSSVTDMEFMFYGCGSAKPDVSNWDVSKVKSFDHMFAYSSMTGLDTSKWRTDSATNLGALFHTVKDTVIDVSNFVTTNVFGFGQMFENCTNVQYIVGLENFDTSSGVDFQEMFSNCYKLKELNLSSFNTKAAKDGVKISNNGGISATCKNMFNNNRCLEKVILGENFSINGDGTTTKTANYATLPTPSSEYIKRANGYWYNEADEAILPANIPSCVADTYCAVPFEYRDFLIVSRGAVREVADPIRSIMKETNKWSLADMIDRTNQMIEANNDLESMLYGNDPGNKHVDSYYDVFWDAYQDNGNRMDYGSAFGRGWTDGNFKPKYDIRPTTANTLFANSNITDLKAILDNQNVVLDFSNCPNCHHVFQYAKITKVGDIDLTAYTYSGTFFGENYNMTDIDKIILKSDGSQPLYDGTFWGAYALVNVVIDGKIGQNCHFSQSSKLSYGSLMSIINSLYDYSPAIASHTLTLHANAKARLSENDIAIATQKGWTIA